MNKLSISYIITFILSILAITIIISYNGNSNNLDNYHQVKIKEGDSLWSIADQFQRKTEISQQDFVKWVQEKNNIHSSLIKPGDLVVVPIEKNDIYQIEQIASE
ncbi:LysM peptidoglycan-binding domain-containing protein [Metabacillus litoralis]|uniref:cell division suppressor protein YneA n=1 Tax=Metabacillus litoralis TaxID=152268 RepID=UPI001CFD046B|nr:LysM peptidoglycan-binding domain-containing protein [Metabacillus litoralis]